MSGMPDKYPALESVLADRDELISLELSEFYGPEFSTELENRRYVDESDVIGGYDPEADWEEAFNAFSESVFDPDYPLGK